MSFISRLRTGVVLGALAALAACGDDDDDSNIITPTPVTTPPSGVTVVGLTASTVQVSWTAASGATRYLVQRAPQTGDFAQVTDTVTGTSFRDTGLQPNTPYRYRVAAIRTAGTSDFSTVAEGSTLAPGRGAATISANITTSRTLSSDTTYTISGFIQVLNGATLTIEPGVKIVGDFDVPGSSLFITRGARIVANGTAQNPIVFTSERGAGQRQPGDWGGLIIIGNAPINRTGQVIIEGTGTGSSNPAQVYSGGTNVADNSGSLRYVRVEFAGFATATDAELNSYTFAAVGSGTQMEYLQAMAGLDDHFEWFGGAADAKHLVSYEAGDDHFDMSEGFSGRLQYVIGLQSTVLSPRP
ncbi:MAG TPA: fibronectin type III domain-containing protein, partial [Gemmatimonadaceae bacterium]|nr:fibronectin type III domain-containing protein [Gemmatimonadaceae bacterium]